MRRSLAFVVFAGILAGAACSSTDAASGCLDGASRSCVGADLSGADLSGRDLSGWDLSDADLTGARLVAASLDHADLTGAVLDGADLSGASLFAATAPSSSWRTADLTAVDLEGTDLRSADLSETTLVGARLHEVNLTGAVLTNADLTAALLARVSAGGADLSGADLDTAVLVETDLDSVLLTGASWQGAVVRDADPSTSALPTHGAVVCNDEFCEGEPVRGTFAAVSVPASAFMVAAFAAARFGAAFGEGPTVVSRNIALSFMAGHGVYPAAVSTAVPAWEPAPFAEADAVRDLSALIAVYSTAIALRRQPQNSSRKALMQVPMLARDVSLWELTRNEPAARSLAAVTGADAARRVLARAAADGFAQRATTPLPGGAWVPTSPAFAPALEPGWGTLLRYATDTSSCAAPAPRSDPNRAAEEMRSIVEAATRDQKDAARFWDDERIRTSTPTGHWALIATEVLTTEVESGRMTLEQAFTTMSNLGIAMADAMIQVWADKYRYRTARPITVLQSSHPGWNSYLGNPPFPAYPSGHAAVSRAAAEVLTRDVGVRSFDDTRRNEIAGGALMLNVRPRSFESFLAAAEEAGLSRIWGGIHVMEDYYGGAHIGTCVAGKIVPRR